MKQNCCCKGEKTFFHTHELFHTQTNTHTQKTESHTNTHTHTHRQIYIHRHTHTYTHTQTKRHTRLFFNANLEASPLFLHLMVVLDHTLIVRFCLSVYKVELLKQNNFSIELDISCACLYLNDSLIHSYRFWKDLTVWQDVVDFSYLNIVWWKRDDH